MREISTDDGRSVAPVFSAVSESRMICIGTEKRWQSENVTKSPGFLFAASSDTLFTMTHHTKNSFNDVLQSQWFWIACLILAWQLFALTFIQSFGSISFWAGLGKFIVVQNPGIRMPTVVNTGLIIVWAAVGIVTFVATRKHLRGKILATTIASSATLVIFGCIFREIYPTLLYILLLPIQNAKYTFSLYAIHRTFMAALLVIGCIGSISALKAKQSTLRILFVLLIIITAGLLYTHYRFGIEDCSHLC